MAMLVSRDGEWIIRALTHALADEVGQQPESHYIRIINPFTTEEDEGLFEVGSIEFIIPNAIPHVFAAAELYPRRIDPPCQYCGEKEKLPIHSESDTTTDSRP